MGVCDRFKNLPPQERWSQAAGPNEGCIAGVYTVCLKPLSDMQFDALRAFTLRTTRVFGLVDRYGSSEYKTVFIPFDLDANGKIEPYNGPTDRSAGENIAVSYYKPSPQAGERHQIRLDRVGYRNVYFQDLDVEIVGGSPFEAYLGDFDGNGLSDLIFRMGSNYYAILCGTPNELPSRPPYGVCD